MTLSVRSGLLPSWTRVEPPDPGSPFWHDEADGQRRHVHELLVGAAPERAAEVRYEHAQAVARLVAAALEAWTGGDGHEARRLCHAAARLSEEVVGFWPASLNVPRRS